MRLMWLEKLFPRFSSLCAGREEGVCTEVVGGFRKRGGQERAIYSAHHGNSDSLGRGGGRIWGLGFQN